MMHVRYKSNPRPGRCGLVIVEEDPHHRNIPVKSGSTSPDAWKHVSLPHCVYIVSVMKVKNLFRGVSISVVLSNAPLTNFTDIVYGCPFYGNSFGSVCLGNRNPRQSGTVMEVVKGMIEAYWGTAFYAVSGGFKDIKSWSSWVKKSKRRKFVPTLTMRGAELTYLIRHYFPDAPPKKMRVRKSVSKKLKLKKEKPTKSNWVSSKGPANITVWTPIEEGIEEYI
jgi:hypothetical protein